MNIITTVSPFDVLWDFKSHDGVEEKVFSDENALALLLMNEVVFLNSYWYKKDWPEDAQKVINVWVNCSDVFAWGVSDAEGIEFNELQDLYEHWIKDIRWGADVWCIKRRKQKPQAPVEKAIREAGVWDLDSIYDNFQDS